MHRSASTKSFVAFTLEQGRHNSYHPLNLSGVSAEPCTNSVQLNCFSLKL